MSAPQQPVEIFRKDYQKPDFTLEGVELHFRLDPAATVVTATQQFRRAEAASGAALVLDGEDLKTVGIWIDGRALSEADYSIGDDQLSIANVPDAFELRTEVQVAPEKNLQFSGLYRSGGNYCTQCEAEGFRRITWSLDRPDVMTTYKVRIEARKEEAPLLLSNGNLTDSGEMEDGWHWTEWVDPFPKPSYLFALVAGPLEGLHDSFKTASGRDVQLHIYSQPHDVDKLDHAMEALKQSMRWDEEVFGLEYDLDIYNIVAVPDFNMGAMENKSLNVFNTAYVLARPDTATDTDYENITRVIGHEYFHNWTGNRVTCQDWFQLTLKEGLTVLRDQWFSGDVSSAAVRRIEDVRLIRARQFAEDGGPMAHPIRPESYIAMDNFYTITVYYKGAEVVGMYRTLLGVEGFRKGMDLYFERHDGQAVSCDDFRAAMADANGRDLSQFERWYDQAGTPVLHARGEYDAATKSYRLHLRQECAPTPGMAEKQPFHIPVAVGLLSESGEDLVGTRVLEMTAAEEIFEFEGIDAAPIPSVLRDFSAPVKLRIEQDDAELAFLMAHDTDAFNRWDAGQRLASRMLLQMAAAFQKGEGMVVPQHFLDAFKRTLLASDLDRSLQAYALSLPDLATLAEEMDVIDPDALHAARSAARAAIAAALRSDLQACHDALEFDEPFAATPEQAGARRLRNLCLGYLSCIGDSGARELAQARFESADNMSDSMAALSCLADLGGPEGDQALTAFADRWAGEALVMDKWFSVQALCNQPNRLAAVQALQQHPGYDATNPNKVRALVGAFAGNLKAFHAADGSGYRFHADQVLELDKRNPQLAARQAGAFLSWRRYDAARQGLIQAELQRLADSGSLSKDTYEIVRRSLDAPAETSATAAS